MIVKALTFLIDNLKMIVGVICFAVAGCLFWGVLFPQTGLQLRKWIKQNGDPEIVNTFAKLDSVKERCAFEATCRCYCQHYGKGAWVEQYKKDQKVKLHYRDMVEVASRLQDAQRRDAFMDSHFPAYEACLEAGRMDEAQNYANILLELSNKGGMDWSVIERNPFAVCVFGNTRDKPDLWNWYMENSEWCDAFLTTLSPENGESLASTLEVMKQYARIFRQFGKELKDLSDEELQMLSDESDLELARENCHHSCLYFIAGAADILEPLLDEKVPMVEAMAVVANSREGFSLETPKDCQAAGRELAAIHHQHEQIWELAADEGGWGVVRLYREVPNWAELVLGAFGKMNVATFLFENYGSSMSLLAAATETLARCQEPGWAVLLKFRQNDQFKKMLENPKIGFRIVPFILKKGEDAAFIDLWKDSRWVDEYFDRQGNLKRQDVSWYEMSPIGGDLATVVKKWAQGRPVTMEEIGWAAFDVADAAGMAFSLGMSKIATTGAKTAGKQIVKTGTREVGRTIGKTVGGKSLVRLSYRVEQKSVARQLPGKLVKSNLPAKVGGRRGLSFWKRVGRGMAAVKSIPASTVKTVKSTKSSLVKSWRGLKKVPKETWEKAYKVGKTMMWIGFAHKVQEKGSDFIHGAIEDLGEFGGKAVHAVITGLGDGLKKAVKEAFGISGDELGVMEHWFQGLMTAGLAVIAFLLVKSGFRKNTVSI